MASLEIFNIKLSDFFHGMSLVCTRDFEGGYSLEYFLEGEAVKVRIEEPDKFARVRARLRDLGEAAKARGGEMKPGAVWRRAGVIEIGISEKNSIYVQAGDVRIEPNEDQIERLLFALTRVQNDYAEVTHADHGRLPPPNYDAARRGFFFTDPFTGELC
jgi:hypothetical protein